MQRLTLYWQLTRFDKPIGILLLLWPTLSALWFASNGQPDWNVVLIFTLGTVLMRAAGCAINDYADRDFDKHVKRTAERPLTAGKIASWEALMVAAVLAVAAFCLIIPLNALTKQLAYLGIAFGFGIPMAYAAIQNQVPTQAWILLIGNVFWAVAYDTEYAMVDRDDDVKIGIRTSAITFGKYDVAAVMFCYAASFALLFAVGWSLGLRLWFSLGMVGAILCAIYHYFLIRNRDRASCFIAFRHNNWLGCLIFIGIALDFALH